jgi:hypothetical protein
MVGSPPSLSTPTIHDSLKAEVPKGNERLTGYPHLDLLIEQSSDAMMIGEELNTERLLETSCPGFGFQGLE